MSPHEALESFHPIVRRWFEKTFSAPTPPQVLGWPPVSAGKHTLILAPTGSGKTLAAFLWAINHLVEQRLAEPMPRGVRILYVSPLKALNNDIRRNLEEPLRGIEAEARELGLTIPTITAAVRTGDTPQSQRAAMMRTPPDILITTPESLYLLLTSKQARSMLTSVQYVIVDEIHALCNNKRGVHLSLSLERLQEITGQDFVRIGLSATQRPLETVAAFLGGYQWRDGRLIPREVTIVDAGRRKEMDILVECPAPDFSDLPAESVWSLVFSSLVEHIRRHATTLIFVNNRRLAERVAAKLNEMLMGDDNEGYGQGRSFNMYAVPTVVEGQKSHPEGRESRVESEASETWDALVQAYHGSMSRTAREQMEADLKAGRIRCLVATSALELGIDIGSIELVIQLQSPKGVARGLQRVGRSGHAVSATSKGRIIPTFREDLVESAVVARSMLEHDVEPTVVPQNCLDVLAQHIVAMVSVDEWDADALLECIRRSYCYRDLPENLYQSVLQMLAGRYSGEAFRELRARISWDKVNNTLRALPGSSRLAITGGGTIADRGYYAVYLEDGTTKVGEVDEEFVHESRAGDTFILGTNVWRITEIDANSVKVTPAPGMPARMPFWRGEGVGRSFEVSRRVGAFRREMSTRIETPECLRWLQREFPIDSHAAWNIEQYFLKQKQSAGVIPHDELIVVEGFRDELGDPRLVVHSSFGRRVNGLLGLLCARRLSQMIGAEPQMLYNDDGVLLRCPDVDELPLDILDGLSADEIERVVLEDLLSSSLFGAQFRMNAARALLLPKRAPGKRTPLWLQRLRAKDLLDVARRFSDFPIVIETIRDVLNDVLDFDQFKEIIKGIIQRKIRVHTVQTEVPSPFAASLLFDFMQVYMYEWDEPKADRLSRFLEINRQVLSAVVSLEVIEEMVRPEAVEEVERRLQHTADGYRARSPEELYEILLRVGDLSEDEIRHRVVEGDLSMLRVLERDGRAIRMNFPSGPRWIAGEERSLYEHLDVRSNVATLVRRYVQTHARATPDDLSTRYGVPPEVLDAVLTSLMETDRIVRTSLGRTAGRERQYVFRPNLDRIHRETITILRKEISPASLRELTAFLFRWQRLHPTRQAAGNAATQVVLEQMQALPLPAEIWERDIFARRIRSYARMNVEALTAAGAVVWVGAGSGKLLCIFRGEGSAFLPTPAGEPKVGEAARRIWRFLIDHGASFLSDIRTGTHLSLQALNNGLAELFWNGIVTNDMLGEILAVKRLSAAESEQSLEPMSLVNPRRNPYRYRAMHAVRRALKQIPGWSGRWSLVRTPAVLGPDLSPDQQAEAQAQLLLQRYGIVAREFYRREQLLPWQRLAEHFQRMELRGEIRRGYFVEGLSGMQYALPAAVEMLRSVRTQIRDDIEPTLLNACDPANPYGRGIPLPGQSEAPARIPTNWIAFARGAPILLIEGNGARIATFTDDNQALAAALRTFIALQKLPETMRPFRNLTILQVNGAPAAASTLAPLLASLGLRKDVNQTLRYDEYV